MDNLLIFERTSAGRRCVTLPENDVPHYQFAEQLLNTQQLPLPEVAEIDLVRHYVNLSRKARGVDNVFYPLGSCTMKYNPKLNEATASLAGFTRLHPLQPLKTLQGALKACYDLQSALCEITGMDQFTLQPAAGAQGEFLGLSMIAKYHQSRNNVRRTKVIVPDSAHGTNPASASMAGFDVISVPSNAQGGVDVTALKECLNDEVAALMLTNPNTLGLFDGHVKEIAELVHQAGGLVYYDGANMNAIMGLSRPGDAGFDVVHLNLHKTFSTPHGGGGPGSGPVGVKEILAPFLPVGTIVAVAEGYELLAENETSVGRMRSFYGNFLVNIRALTYILTNGKDGLRAVSEAAIINANYIMEKLKETYTVTYPGPCMHEFVLSLDQERHAFNVSAKDVSKALLDFDIHAPTMYFPNIVSEALMIEPTETESKETLDRFIAVMIDLHHLISADTRRLLDAPFRTDVLRVDDVLAARHPILSAAYVREHQNQEL